MALVRIGFGLLFFLICVTVGSGLKCYTCSFQYPGATRDRLCLDQPWNVTQGQKVMDCPYPYCIIYRQYMQEAQCLSRTGVPSLTITSHQRPKYPLAHCWVGYSGTTKAVIEIAATKQIYSLLRSCEMKSRGNKCLLDTYYSTCSYTCSYDLCNHGDGIPSGSEVNQIYIGPPAYDPANRVRDNNGRHKAINQDTKKKQKKKKKKKRRRKGSQVSCVNPYTCDQSQYWPKGGASGAHKISFLIAGLAFTAMSMRILPYII